MKYALPDGFNLPRAAFVLKRDLEKNPFRALHVEPGDTVLDVGAYVGTFAVSALQAGAARVVCFEPYAQARAVLERNLAAYGARAEIIAAAVAPEDGTAVLEIQGLAGNQSIVPSKYKKCKGSERVQTVSFRKMLRRFRPAVLKLDVEEAEYDILASLERDDLLPLRDIFIEFHRAREHAAEIASISACLGDAGFTEVEPVKGRSTWRRGVGQAVHVLEETAMSTEDENNTALVILTEFERKLAACTTLGEAKMLRDEAESLRYYAKTMQVGLAAQNRCALARFLVEHRLGEMLAKLPRAPGPGRGKKVGTDKQSFLGRLKAEGIQYPDARRWQRWARVPEAEFRGKLEAWCNGDGLHRALDSEDVHQRVDLWIQDHLTPAQEARADRRWARSCEEAEYSSAPTEEERREDAWWETEIGQRWEEAAGSSQRLQWALKALQRLGADVDRQLALVDPLVDCVASGMEAAKEKLFAAPTA